MELCYSYAHTFFEVMLYINSILLQNEAPEDQADPIQAQELPAHTGIGSQISQQVQQASQETEKVILCLKLSYLYILVL